MHMMVPPSPPTWTDKSACENITFLQLRLWVVKNQLNIIRRYVTGFLHDFTGFLLPANEVWGKVIFLHPCVILFKRGEGVCPPPIGRPGCRTLRVGQILLRLGRPCHMQTPWGWTDPLGLTRSPLGLGRLPQMQTSPRVWQTPQMQTPGVGQTLPPIRSTSGRYASYWDAYLFTV